MQTEDLSRQIDNLQGKVLDLGDRVEGMLIQAADKITSIREWIIYAIRGEDYVTTNV